MSFLRPFALLILLMEAFLFFACEESAPAQTDWPSVTRENKPWTRWWWHGSAVTKDNITNELEAFKKVGLGGVEITPIYGVFGKEDSFIDYLSPQWMEMLEHTLREAERLDLGVDMATGTGWPFGGPWVSSDDACKNVVYKTYQLKGGESLKAPVFYEQEPFVRSVGTQLYELHGTYKVWGQQPAGTIKEPRLRANAKELKIEDLVEPVSANKNLQALALDQVRFKKRLPLTVLMAYSDAGDVVNITDKVDANGTLHWVAPAGNWMLYAVFQGWHGKMVERAAPGGEGNVIDHFSKAALDNYLTKFDSAFARRDITSLRAFFNDSYEVDDARGTANWTPALLEEFKNRRGYDLREHLPALFGQDSEDKKARVLCDYRETISELIYEKFTSVWKAWAGKKNTIVRNQAHGSPANILDLYAEVDIPEMEGIDVLRIKMASSASNVTGKKLTSSESATWLDEHFLSGLSDIKRSLDRFMVSGVNHVFYHGTCYSPQDEPWPGWLFYAAVHLNARNPQWGDFSQLNAYATRCQSFLQNSKPDNDILLYLPVYDRFSTPGREMIEHFDGVERQFEGTAFKEAAEVMVKNGYSFDYISDKQIRNTAVHNKRVQTGGVSYQTILLPHSKFVPLSTFEKIISSIKEGATVVTYKGIPDDVPGLHDLENRRMDFKKLTSQLNFMDTSVPGVKEATLGSGKLITGDDLDQLLKYAAIRREPIVDKGLEFIRKSHATGNYYFISNWTEQEIDGWLPLEVNARSAMIFDPVAGEKGEARMKTRKNGIEVYVQMPRGHSLIVVTDVRSINAESFQYTRPAGDPLELKGAWKVTFLDGGPVLPPPVETDTLVSWTDFSGDAYKNFSGTASYTLIFNKPSAEADGWILDLGNVYETAAVSLNGKVIATLIGPTYRLHIEPSLLQPSNTLEVKVSNLMANRIAYMDKQNIFWKKFYNVNFPARKAENRESGLFTAAHWKPLNSGLEGPIRIIPVKRILPD